MSGRPREGPDPFGCSGVLYALIVAAVIAAPLKGLGISATTASTIGFVIGIVAVCFLYFRGSTVQTQPKTPAFPRPKIPPAVRQAVFLRDNGTCQHCGAQHDLEIDHIIPLSRGGSNTENNLQVLCASCNRSKGNRSVG